MTIERCPTCQQPIKPAKEVRPPMRVCCDCGEYIERGHRYTFQEREGLPVPVTVHRSCEYPGGYFNLATAKRKRVAPYSCHSPKEIQAIEEAVRERCRQHHWICSLDRP